MKSYVKDTYINLKTRTLLHGNNGMSDGEKKIVFNVLQYLATKKKPIVYHKNQTDGGDFISNDLKKIIKSSNTYDEIKNKIDGCKTDECLMAHAILAFHIDPKSLLMLTTAIHTRVRPMLDSGKDGWFDNFTLNSYLYQLTTFVYQDYDNNDNSTYSIAKPKSNLINYKQRIDNPQDILFHLGNLYRCFKEFGIASKEEIYKLNNNEAINKLDKLVEKYPYFTYQCHGCDVFNISDRCCTIKDIFQFCKRYPHTLVGGILNTETYASGKGQHWVCIMFRDSTVYLLCSQAGNFNSFNDNSENNMISELIKYGFAQKYNTELIQKDNSNCGLYSTLFNLVAIMQLDEINKNNSVNLHGGKHLKIKPKNNNFKFENKSENNLNKNIIIPKLNISKIVNQIGINAKGMNSKGIYQLKKRLVDWELN